MEGRSELDPGENPERKRNAAQRDASEPDATVSRPQQRQHEEGKVECHVTPQQPPSQGATPSVTWAHPGLLRRATTTARRGGDPPTHPLKRAARRRYSPSSTRTTTGSN